MKTHQLSDSLVIERPAAPPIVLSPPPQTTRILEALNPGPHTTHGTTNTLPIDVTSTKYPTTPSPTTLHSTTPSPSTPLDTTRALSISQQTVKENMPIPSRQIHKVRVIQSDQLPREPEPQINKQITETLPQLPPLTTTKPLTLPQTLPPATSSGNSGFNDQGFIYKIQNGSGPLDIQNGGNPAVITTTFYPNNKLWGVLSMIGFLLVILVVLLAILLVKKTTIVQPAATASNGEMQGYVICHDFILL